MKAAIFDLDNCLSAADEVGTALYEPAFEAIRQANRGTLTEGKLAAAFLECWRHPLDFVAREYGFSDAMLSAGWRIFESLEVTGPMRGYADLHVLGELPVMRFLVTSGFRRLQESKVAALGFQHLFADIFIDAIDNPNRKGKQQLFAQTLEEYRLALQDALVIGDNADSEIRAGNNLGIKTVQILRPGVPFADNASCHIRSLIELKPMLE